MAVRLGILAPLLAIVCVSGCDDGGSSRSSGAAGDSDAAAEAPLHSPAKTVVIAWAKAYDEGDLAAVRALSVGTAEQMKALDAAVAAEVSENRFNATLDARFPNGESSGVKPQGLAATAEQAGEKVEGDTVTVAVSVRKHPLIVRKQPGGEWKVALDHFTGATEVESRADVQTFDRMTEKVNAGEYASRERALDALLDEASARGVEPPTEVPDEVPAEDVPDPDAPAPASAGDPE